MIKKNHLFRVIILSLLLTVAVSMQVISAPPVGEATTAQAITGSLQYDLEDVQIHELPSGNIVIAAPSWNQHRGAVICLTPEEAATGGIVISASNALVGSTPDHFDGDYSGDNIGEDVYVLENGNYVVASPQWINGTTVAVGAVTWVNGSTCIPYGESSKGALVSPGNSLVGSTEYDEVGTSVIPLTNGNYVIDSSRWKIGGISVGAVTFANGATGMAGAVSTLNSLHGTGTSKAGGGVFALPNGNYVVRSIGWDNDTVDTAGAVTWADGTTGITGPITTENSLHGTTAGDAVGNGDILILSDSDYVVLSYKWTNGADVFAGAATWVDGSTGIPYGESSPGAAVSTSNSLYGDKAGDGIGDNGAALTNGHYVVGSWGWNNGGTQASAGILAWANGDGSTVGPVTTSNALYGTKNGDRVGFNIIPLANGNYVVHSEQWDNGATGNVGAVTWVDGSTGIPYGETTVNAAVSTTNSLYGATASDAIGNRGVTALENGNYVVSSPWVLSRFGAVTWVDGSTGMAGTVSASNSLVGSTANDYIGNVVTLSNSNYLVYSGDWDNGGTANVGAVTWVNGADGVPYGETVRNVAVSVDNSLIGASANDVVGSGAPTLLTNGNYVVPVPNWDNGGTLNAGAVVRANASGLAGVVSTSNALYGTTTDDLIGEGNVVALDNGNYVVVSPSWDNGGTADVGAVVLADGSTGLTGPVTTSNAFYGGTASDKIGDSFVAGLSNGDYLVYSRAWNGEIGAVFYVESNILDVALASSSVTIDETTGGNGNLQVSVSGGAIVANKSVTLTITDGETDSSDYEQISTTFVIPAGDYSTPQNITIPTAAFNVLDDAVVEADETFTVSISSSEGNLSINGSANSATVTITDNDTATVTVEDVTIDEGDSGTSNLTFTATLDNAIQAGSFTVDYATSDDSATAGEDYTAKSGTLTFAGTAGEKKTFTVSVTGDTKVESDETFTVTLSSPSNTSVTASDTATGTITNDDGAVVLVADLAQNEGNAGTSTMTFTATLQAAVDGSFTVKYVTSNGTATAGEDYTAKSGTLTFAGTANETQTFTVSVNGDMTVESDETFTVTLSAPSNGNVTASDTATGTITNDDFTIDVLTDGGFEGKDKFQGTPLAWSPKNTTILGKDKQKCNKPLLNKYLSRSGDCAFMFKGNADGSKSKINQKIEDLTVFTDGATVTFSAYVDNRSAKVGNAIGKLIIVYSDGNKERLLLTAPDADGYALVSDSTNIDLTGRAVILVKAQFRYKLTSGKFFLDDASLTVTPAMALRTERDLLPLPELPDGFRD